MTADMLCHHPQGGSPQVAHGEEVRDAEEGTGLARVSL
jgi:hypothetical protein